MQKKSPKVCHLGTIAQLCRTVSLQLRHLSTIGKKLLNSNISSTCLHNMANFSLLAAEIGSGVCGTPANFNRFRILPSLLQQRQSPEANQTLHSVWPFPGLVHYIHINTFSGGGGSCPLREFCQVQNSLYVQVLHSTILTALLHATRVVGISQTLQGGTRNECTEFLQRVLPIWQGGHHVGHRPTFLVGFVLGFILQ